MQSLTEFPATRYRSIGKVAGEWKPGSQGNFNLFWELAAASHRLGRHVKHDALPEDAFSQTL